MLRTVIAACLALCLASPALAVDFLGIKLCKGGVTTAVKMPEGSALEIESVALGKHGGLVIRFTSDDDDILGLIDDFMTGSTGAPGSGDETKLQWSGNKLFGYASVIKKGQVALAVSTSDECLATETPEPPAAVETASPEPPAPSPVQADQGPEPSAAAIVAPAAVPGKDHETAEFELRGKLKHTPAEDAWVDVMGVIVNSSDSSYQLATFDLSFFDGEGNLICVDTISVSELKSGQQRPFRDSIQCPDYSAVRIASHQLHFAGGY